MGAFAGVGIAPNIRRPIRWAMRSASPGRSISEILDIVVTSCESRGSTDLEAGAASALGPRPP
jgi:hypothetical protein